MAQVMMSAARREISQNRREKVRTRRIVNIRLLAVSVLAAAVFCPIAYFWHGYRTNQLVDIFAKRAAELEHEGRWQEAAGYLNRHLQLEPDNHQVRVRLVELVERSVETARQRRQLIGLLYETLGLLPQRNDLRLKLANELLDTGNFVAAEVEARKLLASTSAEDQRAARRIIALSLRARARSGGPLSIEEAAAAMTAALVENPGDVTLAASTAELYREYPQDVATSDAATQADAIMNRLVDADPHHPEALIARYNYRRRYTIDQNARQDLDAILARDPDHVEALLLIAGDELSTGHENDRSAAEKKLLRVVELRPQDPRGYVGLAHLYDRQRSPQRAIEVLTRGREKLSAPSFELDGLLSGMLIDASRLDEAEGVLANIDGEFRRLLPELTTNSRMRLENFIRLLWARLSIARNQLGRATRELDAIVASLGKVDATAGAAERMHAYSLLARVMSKMGRPDLAAAHWDAVVENAPNFSEARLHAAAAYLELSRPGEAIRELEAYLQSSSAAPQTRIALVEAHLQQQMRLSPDERNWSEFLTVLQQARKQLPLRWELPLAEVLYWHALGTDDAKRQAMDQLRRLERSHPSDGALWGRMVLAYQQLDAPSDAERALARFDELEANKGRVALLQSTLWVNQGRPEDASKLLEAAAGRARAEERLELQIARIKLLVATRQSEAAQKVVTELIAASPRERALLSLGLEIALARQDFAAAARWEDALKGLEAVDDFDWRYFRARRLIGQFAKLEAAARSELESLVESLRSDRPDWFPVVALAGQHDDLKGNRRQAIDSYRLAIELGDNRPETFERLIAVLYAEGRSNEANLYLARLGSEQPANGRIESLAIALAIKQNRLAAALDMAKQAVDRGSTDPMHYVWLANLLSLKGHQKEAERVFRDSIERYPKDPRVWNALFTYLVRIQQPDRARRVLDQWMKEVTIEEPDKHFILAQGYELLGDVAAAQEQYRAAVAKDSRNVDARLRLAKLLASGDVAATRGQFEEVLKIDPNNVEARRYLASLLAASGDEQDWTRATQLLQPGERSAKEASTDDRLRAILLSRRGRNRAERLTNCEAARRILTTRLGQSDGLARDLDRMLLAGVYEQEAVMRDDPALVQAARDTLRPLVDRDNAPADYLVTYVQFLLRHLEQRYEDSDGATQYDELRAVLADDARRRIGELETLLRERPAAADPFVPIALRVRLLAAEDERKEGLRILDEFAQKRLQLATGDRERGKLLLQVGNLATVVGSHDEAEGWYRRLLEIAPNSYILLAQSLVEQDKLNDAVEVCLRLAPNRPAAEVATVLSQLLSTGHDHRGLDDRIRPLVESALVSDGNNVELLMSVAVRYVTEDNNDEAIKLFRRILDLQPNHTLALNNLATLLAERSNQLPEARKCVEQAIAGAGRNPALLDTLGTILVRSGQYDEAVLALEEAVAGTASDPRYYFHLAVAYQRSGRDADAREALKVSRKFGLDRAILTSGDRELLASLNQELLTAAYPH